MEGGQNSGHWVPGEKSQLFLASTIFGTLVLLPWALGPLCLQEKMPEVAGNASLAIIFSSLATGSPEFSAYGDDQVL